MVFTSKKKKDFNKKVENEANQIFTKIYRDKYKEFPVINKNTVNTPYAKDYDKVYKQVKKVRTQQAKQAKANKKK